MSKNHEKI